MHSGIIRSYPLVVPTLALAILIGMVWLAQRVAHPDLALAVTQLEFNPLHSNTPPSDIDGWMPVTLPDDWYNREKETREGWYRHRFELKVPPNRLWGIYLPTVHHNAAVYLNGELLGSGGSFNDPVTRNWNRPLYFTIPNGLLQPDANKLEIRLKTDPANTGLLSQVFLGPDEGIRPFYEMRYFMRYTVAQFIVLMQLLISALMAMLWWQRRSDSLYAWFSFGLAEWALHNSNLIVTQIPLTTLQWENIVTITILWFPVITTSFIQRYIGDVRLRIERYSYICAAVLSLGIIILPEKASYWVSMNLANPLALSFGVYPVVRLMSYAWKNLKEDVFLLLISGMTLLLFGTHDLLVANHFISRVDGYFLHYSAPVGLLSFAWILIKRFVAAMNETERMNLTLEKQIQQKHQELEQNYARTKKLEHERVLAEERERLMRDMHDGMGGHLVSTLALLESEAEHNKTDMVRDALRAALDDLRLMIDSMDEVDGDVVTVLAMLRERMQLRLQAAGIEIEWHMAQLPPLDSLGPEKSLQILRIFQEALTNILKHANASLVVFEARVEQRDTDGICIECRDNGKGIDPVAQKSLSDQPSGRGLVNIQHRAKRLQGQAGFDSAQEGGFKVWLWIPLKTME